MEGKTVYSISNKLIPFTVLLACLISAIHSTDAQILSPLKSDPSGPVKDQISSVYKLTQSAQRAADYSEIDARCTSILEMDLNEENRKYVSSLASWALCRRGFTRADLADSFLAAGNSEQGQIVLEQAKNDFDKSIARDKTRWRAYLGRGMVMTSNGKMDQAQKDFKQVTVQQPDHMAGWFNLAEVQYELMEYEAAIESYSKVIAADPADAQAYTGRGHCQFAGMNYEAAMDDYKIARQLAPLNQVAKCNCGEAAEMLGDWQTAYECYMQATKVNPLPAAYRKAASLLATCPDSEYSRPKEALELIDKAIAMQGTTLENLRTLKAVQSAGGHDEMASATELEITKLEAAKSSTPSRVAETPEDKKNR